MKKILTIILLLLVFSCTTNEDNLEKSEEELVNESTIFNLAYQINEIFYVEGYEVKLVEVSKSILFIGTNKNESKVGVRLYLDYSSSIILNSEIFKVIDVYGNKYTPITDDGLDFLGLNRFESSNKIGYLRLSLLENHHHYLLNYSDENHQTKYIKFSI